MRHSREPDYYTIERNDGTRLHARRALIEKLATSDTFRRHAVRIADFFFYQKVESKTSYDFLKLLDYLLFHKETVVDRLSDNKLIVCI